MKCHLIIEVRSKPAVVAEVTLHYPIRSCYNAKKQLPYSLAPQVQLCAVLPATNSTDNYKRKFWECSHNFHFCGPWNDKSRNSIWWPQALLMTVIINLKLWTLLNLNLNYWNWTVTTTGAAALLNFGGPWNNKSRNSIRWPQALLMTITINLKLWTLLNLNLNLNYWRGNWNCNYYWSCCTAELNITEVGILEQLDLKLKLKLLLLPLS